MAKGKKRPAELPEYGTVMMKGVQYYRTRITAVSYTHLDVYKRQGKGCDCFAKAQDCQVPLLPTQFNHRL